MKKFIVMMLVVLASITNLMASTNINYEYNGVNIIEHVIDDKNFNIIKVGFPSIITIKENDTFGINIRTNEEYLSDKIKYVIKDSTLVIWVENIDYEEIRIYLNLPLRYVRRSVRLLQEQSPRGQVGPGHRPARHRWHG